ncbi:hypothetical protein EOD39_15030 [Acipenser ruthenus]|uniref:Uncharacterized protein n=1 Tax=Acipenser ruthenus TaxID=7906 RepID=A0A444UEC0_ACIRT|nr:hypothetical protein EOD39_15030 [Acipenser ruthenus]
MNMFLLRNLKRYWHVLSAELQVPVTLCHCALVLHSNAVTEARKAPQRSQGQVSSFALTLWKTDLSN